MTGRTAILLALSATVAFAGCGVTDPYQRADPPPTPTQRGASDGPAASPAPARPQAPVSAGPQPSARGAASRFAQRWINWSWRDVSQQQRDLATLAAPSYAAQLRADARHSGHDRSLLASEPEQSGRAVAIVLHGRGSRRAGVVVTREQTFTNGAEDSGGPRYRVYLVILAKRHERWVVRSWQPQL